MESIIILNSNKNYNKKIKKCMYQDKFKFNSPKLNKNSFFVVKIDDDNNWLSFLHCVIRKRTLIFSFGFTNINFRRKGLSSELRIWVIENIPDIDKYESLPMPGSYSKILLEKIGFIEENNKMVKYIK
jgi:hypothetical protein